MTESATNFAFNNAYYYSTTCFSNARKIHQTATNQENRVKYVVSDPAVGVPSGQWLLLGLGLALQTLCDSYVASEVRCDASTPQENNKTCPDIS